jgi:AraC family transcriptional regulator of adaptative response/methylated-DNA-[protein]-cysteine methyltransferase
MTQFDQIAEIIRYLDQSRAEQPDLAVLAGRSGLSPFHLHRLFTRWAAITPKDFLQCLTVAHAKKLLRQGETVLEASLASGLSGPGRLHDLCVTLEAATPGEWKSGGEGWTLSAGLSDSPFGRCLIAESPRGICHLAFVQESAKAWAELKASWPGAKIARDDRAARRVAVNVFTRPEHRQPALRAFVKGTAFQVKVWRALLRIPSGRLLSYGQLAGRIGQPSAARAVGAAVGQNQLSYLIPCHRVIRETGVIGEYRWGAVRKRAMLAWESAASD